MSNHDGEYSKWLNVIDLQPNTFKSHPLANIESALSGKEIGHINSLKNQIDNKYMNRRIFGQKFKDNASLHRLNADHANNIEVETTEMPSRSVCRCKKYAVDSQWDTWKDILPPVTNTFYFNRNQVMKDSIKSPNVRATREYFHSQKHMSENFQQFLQSEKSKAATGVINNVGNPANGNFKACIEGNGIHKITMAERPVGKHRYMEEWSEQAKQTYAYESDGDFRKKYYSKGASGVHGSQCFQTPDGLIEVLKNHKHQGENRGHSIGHNQNSADSNGLADSGKCES